MGFGGFVLHDRRFALVHGDLPANASRHLRGCGADLLAGGDQVTGVLGNDTGPLAGSARHVLIQHLLVAGEAAGVDQDTQRGTDRLRCTVVVDFDAGYPARLDDQFGDPGVGAHLAASVQHGVQ